MRRLYFLFLILLSALAIMLCSCEEDCTHKAVSKRQIDATCTQSGEIIYTCDGCGYTYRDSIIEPRGHVFTKTTIAPSCTKDGYTKYICECGFSYTADIISATGHNYQNTVTPPTCTSEGYATHKCKICDYSYISNHTDPISHSYTETVYAPTCTNQGYTLYSCQSCSHEYASDYVAPTVHSIICKVTVPTCENSGSEVYSCTECEYSYETQIEPLAHKLTSSVTPPTCDKEGYTTYACENCEYTYISDHVKPIGHNMSVTTLSPTCVEEGKTVYSCQKCDYSYSELIKPSGHDFSGLVTMPTLSDMGYTEYSCKNENCGFTYTGDIRFYSDILPNGAYANNSTAIARGIDVSQYNYGSYESIDFASIKEAGIDYVIIKAGSSYRDGFSLGGTDPKFEQSYSNAKAAGLDIGVYFYTYAKSVNDIIQDARLLISILDGKQFEYPIYLDLEDDSLLDIDKSTITEMCVEFFTILQRAGYYTGLYINDSWLKNNIDTETALDSFEIWYARPNSEWDTDRFGENLGMWQYSFEGSFDSMPDVPFDMNYTYKNYPEIIKNGGFNGYSTDEIKFVDSGKEFVYVSANSIYIRSDPDFESNSNLIGTAYFGDFFEIVEKTDDHIKIKYNGQYAYITANINYVAFDFPVK